MVSRAPDISERTIIDLSGRTNTYYDPTGNAFDCAIAGMPFIMAVTDNTPYKRQTAEFRSQRVDQLRDPGEHTLSGSGYWIRSQSSFHYGDGALFSEPLEGNMDEVKFRFRDSYGVNPWTPGELSLMKKTTLVQAMRGKCMVGSGTSSSENVLFAIDLEAPVATTTSASAATGATTISVASTSGFTVGWAIHDNASMPSTSTVTAIGTGTVTFTPALTGALTSGAPITTAPVTAMYKISTSSVSTSFANWSQFNYEQVVSATTDGRHAYHASNNHLWDIDLTTGTVHEAYYFDTTLASNVTLKYVKSRVICGVTYTDGTTAVYELTFPNKGSGAAIKMSLQTPINGSTVMPNGFVWTGITEARNAIYIGGYSGELSTIYKLQVGSDGSLGTIVTTAVLPRSEICNTLFGYLGTYVMIGTSKGVRVATSDTNGDITYGPLTYVNSNGVLGFEARDSFVWVTSTNGINTNSGTYRIDLATPLTLSGYATPVATGNYAKAADAFANAVTGTVRTVRIYDGQRVAFAVDGSGIWVEHKTDLVEEGQIRFPRIRFDTLENKAWKRFRVRTPRNLAGEIDIYSIGETSDTLLTSIAEDSYASEYDYDLVSVLPDVSQDASFKLKMFRNSTDATTGAVVYGTSVKALPTPTRARVIQIPIFIYDKETDKNGNIVGYEGYARQRLANLEEIEAQGKTVIFQDFNASNDAGGAPVEVAIEQITFTRSTPASRRYTGYGGIAQIIARTIV